MNRELLKEISILYVEDEKDVREFTAKLLATLVKKVFVAQNGLEGLETFKENQKNIDLIVSDINMPKMDGLEMCKQIKAINKDIPLVITSAYNDPSFLKKAIDIGVSTYAMKPIDLYQLIDSIIKAIEPIILKRKLEELNLSLETRIEQEISKIKSILDAQDNIIIVSNSEKIVNVNKKFLEFFQIDHLNSFPYSNSIIEFFRESYGFITRDLLLKQSSWIEYIKHLPEIDRVVKIKNYANEDKIFTLNIDNYENKDDNFVISLTDITQIQEKSNLLEYQASHDKLTGLYNRNKFDEIFGKELRRSQRYEYDLSLIIFDIDDFKKVNDKFGHQIGDEVLIEISKIVLLNVREHDLVVRWGGEEFLVLLPNTKLEGAVSVAQKIKEVIYSTQLSSKKLNITSSFGVSTLRKDDLEKDIIARADKALYDAKETGKNKVIAN
jgi:two-component system, cell cycle response regulator